MATQFLKITAISELLQTKNGDNYRKISLKPTTAVGNLTIHSARRPFTKLCFGQSKDKQGTVIQADELFNCIQDGSIKVGDGIDGTNYTFKTTRYMIDNKEVESYSLVCFKNENPVKSANRALKLHKACVILEDEVTAPENLQEPMTN